MTQENNLTDVVTPTLPGQPEISATGASPVYNSAVELQKPTFLAPSVPQNPLASSSSALSGEPHLDYWVRIAEGPDHFQNFQMMDPSTPVDWPHHDVQPLGLTSDPPPNDWLWSTEFQSEDTSSQALLALTTVASSTSSNGDDRYPDEEAVSIDDNQTDAEDTNFVDEVTKQLSSQVGRLQITEDLQARYFGATSNLHIFYSGPDALSQPNLRTIKECGSAAISKAGLDWPGNPEYEELLTNLFFAWHNPLMNVVDLEAYLLAKRLYALGQDTPLYSPCLENAIYAVGASFAASSPREVPDMTSELFAFRAKTYLEIEMDSPGLATVQALLVLSAHEMAQMRDSRGWLYCGMAVQISSDLGLHLNLEKEHSHLKTSLPDSNIFQVLTNLFWTINSSDRLLSSSFGRPPLMKGRDYNVPKPSAAPYSWSYVDDSNQRGLPPHIDASAAGGAHVHLAQLAMITGRVSDELYSGVRKTVGKSANFVEEIALELAKWKESLPPALRIKKLAIGLDVHLPVVYELQ
ncbi:uncharacterized protein A1O5_04028 [Cladophialophora psammophila CBS 110553]|uniref:Xylanolytic transcriptional activator regulatory domain-containing protein n=1 Tax=Cladophialophora psammophila CBS 110553 TaxID=1182543 RepID=W9X6E7_9EURO|nr:uncharacterized protein A1O5_04028 [Cladophialophora psammophila CBS 110553]EXJ72880.1 hypothetical protein A1O5_04028 [Cladophialophora psammophila CBS 110553]